MKSLSFAFLAVVAAAFYAAGHAQAAGWLALAAMVVLFFGGDEK